MMSKLHEHVLYISRSQRTTTVHKIAPHRSSLNTCAATVQPDVRQLSGARWGGGRCRAETKMFVDYESDTETETAQRWERPQKRGGYGHGSGNGDADGTGTGVG